MGFLLKRDLVVVTGASRGIGRATAMEAARRGCNVLMLARSSAHLQDTIRQAQDAADGGTVGSVIADLQDTRSIEQAGHSILRQGVPRALINNAGIVERQSLLEMSLESLRRQLDVNLIGSIWMSKQVLPAMLDQQRGAIINVSSISGCVGSARQIAYNASKWATIGFTKSLAEELTDTGVMTCTVLPGAVDTEMLKGSAYPPRMTPHDVAQSLLHYALDAPTAHNGAVIEMFGT